jgi:hypothetical protein
MTNYDASHVGVPYVRAHRIVIEYPDAIGIPEATVEQSLAVKLADGSVRKLQDLPAMTIQFDFADHGTDPIPLVSPEDASSLGADTTLNTAMLNILAVIRQAQIKAETPN